MQNDKNLEDLKECFLLYDKRGDERIECSQVGEVLRALDVNPTEHEVQKIVNNIDPAGEMKRVSFEEFYPMYQNLRERHRKERSVDVDYFMECFKVFDRNGNGLIGAAELRHLLASLGDKLSDEEVDNLMVGFEDNQGQVFYEDFVRAVMNG
ncbi:predicted protein [Nematostella vectensis]|uniref:EF-hand domain-containing protein n=1 Tax=Nematostella vectensis TaxID=45351 RepID=A7RV39_NEMVE|nr:predicted protein [Nematostella vectensis]|eukprot:XP_001636745.1 predicted protein [Nematostella vectensis]